MEDAIKLLIGIAILFIVGVTVVVPVLNSIIGDTTAHGSVSEEAWAGVAGTGHTLANNPVSSDTVTMTMLRNTTVTNVTPQYTGLGTAPNKNNASLFLTQTPFTTPNANISILYNATVDNQSVSINGHKLANITGVGDAQTAYFSNITSSWLSTPSTYVEFSSDLNFNVTSITFNYSWKNAYTSFTLDRPNGIVTPSHSGRFYSTYVWGITNPDIISSILWILPILVALIVLVFGATALTGII